MSRGLIVSSVAVLVTACTPREGIIPAPLAAPKDMARSAAGVVLAETQPVRPTETAVSPAPVPPVPDRVQAGVPAAAGPAQAPGPEEANISLAFEQIPLPAFAQAVFGTILRRNVSIDTAVMNRADLVTLRTGAAQTPSQVFEVARMVLKSYGVAVYDISGTIRVVPDNTQLGYRPEILRGRALPNTPLPLRPVFQLVELQAVRTPDVANWLKTLLGERVKVQEDSGRNALLVSGGSDDVRAALEVIHVLDQPQMKGRQSIRITPLFWSADELAKKLVEVLLAEGYGASLPVAAGGVVWPITVMPVSGANAVFVFSPSKAILGHVAEWAKELDQAGDLGGSRSLFSYQARYTDAAALAATLEKLLGASQSSAQSTAGGAAKGSPVRVAAPTRVVVDAATNTLIFQGGGTEFGDLRGLLQAMDKPAMEALIEVTVAEVTLKDSTELGVEWLLKDLKLGGYGGTAGTLGNLALGDSGFNIRAYDSSGDLRVAVNALASSNRATILSSPRVVARNGETATIQVGQEVPIVTSQQTNTTATGGVLQTIQYRNTGVILNVKPVIHSGDQIDLDVTQEVSAAQSTNTGVSVSPTFTTRKLQTKLSLKDGDTVLLGGLIASNRDQGGSGIPLLKDIPLLGQVFRKDTDSGDRTELIILITPYIIGDDRDAKVLTEAFRSQLGDWARGQGSAAAAAEGMRLKLDGRELSE